MPGWLQLSDVQAFLGLADTADDGALTWAAAATEPFTERARPEAFPADDTTGVPDFTGTPAPDAYQASVQLAARLYQRRNSLVGIAAFNDLGGPVYVAGGDPDIDRGLRIGRYARPRLG